MRAGRVGRPAATLAIGLCGVTILACKGSEKASPHDATRRPRLDLIWDKAVGWELRRPFPPGKTTRQRKPTEYLTLAYASLDDAQIARAVVPHGGLRNKSLIATPDEICHPNLKAIVSRAKPDRLLIHLGEVPQPKHAKCLARLGSDALYLGLCGSRFQCDGDRQLAVLASEPTLLPKVRAIGGHFAMRRAWSLLSRFAALEYVAVRGEALNKVDDAAFLKTCLSPELRYLDLLDPGTLGRRSSIPLHCIFRLQEYLAQDLPRYSTGLEFASDYPPRNPDEKMPACSLREVTVWEISDDNRALLARCPFVMLRGVRDEAHEP